MIDGAALRVHVLGIPVRGTAIVLTARDTASKQLVKRAALAGQTSVELVFEKGTLADGAVDLGAVVTDDAGTQLACGAALAKAIGVTAALELSLANDNDNCGACGRTCGTPANATRDCVKSTASCGPVVCQSGWFNVNNDDADGCETTCAAPLPEDSTTTCKNGLDDDCDGKKDCADEQCQLFTRACSFGGCTGTQSWDCATDTWSSCSANQGLENSVATCSDGIDNDCDTRTDCADDGCNGFTRACMVQTCPGTQAWTCSGATWSACVLDPFLEATIASCSDGIDNDCDGKKDCQDSDCLNIKQSCGANLCAAGIKTWLCNVNLFSVCVPYVALPETSDLLCGDGLDNDCDGKTDCQDSDCTGKRCGLGKVCCPSGSCAAACP